MKKVILSILLCFAVAASHGKVRYDIQDPEIVAQSENLTLSADVVELFWKVYNHPANPLSPPQAMQKIIDDALLARYARRTLPETLLREENQVGFLLDVQHEDRLTALLRKAHELQLYQAIQQLPGKSLDGIYQFSSGLTDKVFKDAMALKSRVNIEATADQVEWAKNTRAATVNLSGKPHHLSLWDIYRRQNVQGRLAMHNGDYAFLRAQVKQRIGSLFVLDWANQHVSPRDLSAIGQIVKNEHDKNVLLKSMGLYADVHDDNPVLREKAKAVTEEEVLAFYAEHKDEFEVVEKVKAQRIQLTSQQQADAVYKEIQEGLAFNEAVRKYSVAEDKQASPPGDLGWLKRNDKQRSWLHSVAFTQPQGAISMPFRSPQNGAKIVYEILYIKERVDGYLPVTDPTVRYEASRDVALKQLKAEFYQLQTRLRNAADISLNKNALKR